MDNVLVPPEVIAAIRQQWIDEEAASMPPPPPLTRAVRGMGSRRPTRLTIRCAGEVVSVRYVYIDV